MSNRRAILFVNPSRNEAVAAAQELAQLLIKEGFQLFTSSDVAIDGVMNMPLETLVEIEIAIVLGGDGTILRGAEATLLRDIPLLGINLGKVGFLAEVTRPQVSEIATSIVNKSYVYENRMVLGYSVERGGVEISKGWALNEITVERDSTTMVELFVEIDNVHFLIGVVMA